MKKVIKPKPLFEEDELAERIHEAYRRASAIPVFKEFRVGSIGLSQKQDAFVKLWIEEALRHAHSPSGRQAARAEAILQREALLHLTLTSAQKRELVRVYDEPFPEDRESWRTRERIPMSTYQVLHAAGLVSTTQNVTELGCKVAVNIKNSSADG